MLIIRNYDLLIDLQYINEDIIYVFIDVLFEDSFLKFKYLIIREFVSNEKGVTFKQKLSCTSN